ncbi:LysM peptidoglycan-binding domain-containing protein [Pelotalea chapellei]|uniref:LysM peptidoglycan-binding domain-containing protein n=1 Tax=Pelotalea chapellei TaxID=44671 RepID=A0ABS5U870_9BACT|nr:LysM peptidoglycan-binding domain-containing protein [Pelotalea chapellei]MBT1071855.1 LysM peptidoglycan-binding domain-containing protein [Pelotalea chapellei]
MTRRAPGITLAALLLMAVPVFGQQYYLYSPAPVSDEEKSQPKDGVLVREVPVKKGDTLSGLSRKFSGHGTYFPQILLFNDISNPDLIYAGDTLKVPVTRKPEEQTKKRTAPKHAVGPRKKPLSAHLPKGSVKGSAEPKAELSPDDLKQTERTSVKKPIKRESAKEIFVPATKATSPVAAPAPQQSSAPAADNRSAQAQNLFERAMKAYRQDDCRTALDLFDRFLAADPASPLAADASLYKADCYLKQSNQ